MATTEKTKSTAAARRDQTGSAISPFEAMDALFDDYFTRGFSALLRTPWFSHSPGMQPFAGKQPKVDILDKDNSLIVRAEMPGVERKDLEVTVTHNSVTIKGSSSHEKKEESGDYYRCEISQGSYARTLMLPTEVLDDKAKAHFKDGVLELTLPKAAQVQQRSLKID